MISKATRTALLTLLLVVVLALALKNRRQATDEGLGAENPTSRVLEQSLLGAPLEGPSVFSGGFETGGTSRWATVKP